MTQTPLGQMADRGYDNGSEESGYILHELKLQMRGLSRRIEEGATKKELQDLFKNCERLFANQDTFQQFLNHYQDHLQVAEGFSSLRQAVNLLAKDQDDHKCYVSDVEISSSELLELGASPIVLIPPPPTEFYPCLQQVEFFMPYNNNQYVVGATQDLSLEFSGGSQLAQFETTGFLDQASDQRKVYTHPTQLGDVVIGEAVVLKMLNGEITTGNSPLKVRVRYRQNEAIV